jgi:hypothetical protein
MSILEADTRIPQARGITYYASRLPRKARLAQAYITDWSLQWFWGLLGIPAEKIGLGHGPLSWARRLTQKRTSKDIHICLLEIGGNGLSFGPLTAWAINRGSKRCSVAVNGDLSRADVIWVYSQDPLPPKHQAELERRIRTSARSGTPIINAPATYNSYHAQDAFQRLSSAGVCVPRHTFTEDDIGKVQVVYKASACQGAPKVLALYDGPRAGAGAFEFVDSRGPDGLFRRYRAHYLAGMVRPSEVFVSRHWNVCFQHASDIEYVFDVSEEEQRQIRMIAQALGLDYFAVDYLRRASDGAAVFTDVNVYPTIQSPPERVRRRGDFGMWHTFDARQRMGIPEPMGVNVWDEFDSAITAFVRLNALRSKAPLSLDTRYEDGLAGSLGRSVQSLG